MNNGIKLLHLFSIGLYPLRTILLLCEIYTFTSVKCTQQGVHNDYFLYVGQCTRHRYTAYAQIPLVIVHADIFSLATFVEVSNLA